jgi:hypothetical protein
VEVRPSEDFTFARALSMGLMRHVESCVDTAEQATKEFNIENSLNEMARGWEGVNF